MDDHRTAAAVVAAELGRGAFVLRRLCNLCHPRSMVALTLQLSADDL